MTITAHQLPQYDGNARPALVDGEEGSECQLVVLDAGDVLHDAADPSTRLRGIETLDCEVRLGEGIHIELEAKGLVIEDAAQLLVWQGTPHACYFSVRLPLSTRERGFHIRVRVFIEAAPVGSLCFTLGVSSEPLSERQEMTIRGEFARRYRAAFISYASADRPEVLKRVQVIRQLGINIFQDILSLDPGNRWKLRLFEEINRCDVFMLFWSRKARASKWVLREVSYALKQQTRSPNKLPDIKPVILEGPPPPRPPKSLQHIHFDDPICYVIGSSRREADMKVAADRPTQESRR